MFSTVFDLLSPVVCRQLPAVKAAYEAPREGIGVSLTSVYHKLNGMEPSTSEARVRYSTERVLDGNALTAREHRLWETHTRTAAPCQGSHGWCLTRQGG